MTELRYEELPPSMTGRRSPSVLVYSRSSGDIRKGSLNTFVEMLDRGDVVIFNDSLTLPADLPLDPNRSPIRFFNFRSDGCMAISDWVPPGPSLHELGLQLESHDDELMNFRYSNRTLFMKTLLRSGRIVTYGEVPLALENYRGPFSYVPGSCEFPSASFHFNRKIISEMRARGVSVETITLHTSASGLKEEGSVPRDEHYKIPRKTAEIIRDAIRRKARIIAVGTSSARAIESYDALNMTDLEETTSVILKNDRKPLVATGIVTGFHDRGSSHYELIRSFVDSDVLERINSIAMNSSLSSGMFGDLCIIV